MTFTIECDICKQIFKDLDVFEEHWLEEHSITLGPRSYKKITYTKGGV